MISAFGAGCAAYALGGYCAQSLTSDTLPSWWGALMASLCPASCNPLIFRGGIARRALKAQKLEAMTEANATATVKLNTIPLVANFTFSASPY